ncbi:MAG: single-stranded DNA-binding protein [Bacteroidales bacterium]|nr:single-stranded DNA-binding protein [Bacteroidales bacterium]
MDTRNFVRLVGNLGIDPKVTETRNGKVARFSLATTENYFENGKQVDKTEWHNVVAWNSKADYVAENCTKGSHVVVMGRLASRSYDDQNNVRRYITEVVAEEIICEWKAGLKSKETAEC